jgi:RNA polymerase sigma-70 factor (ECF subfamily)
MSQVAPDPAALLLASDDVPSEPRAVDAVASAARDADRVRSIVTEHYAPLWRFLRRLGVRASDAEDAAQKCLCVVAQRIVDVAPGKEKPFLFGVAVHVAKAARREQRRTTGDDASLTELPAVGPDAAEQLDAHRARVLLDVLLESMPLDLRTVFVLYELEELTMAEIARTLELPAGTVASRLRRAREAFEELSRRLRREIARKEAQR